MRKREARKQVATPLLDREFRCDELRSDRNLSIKLARVAVDGLNDAKARGGCLLLLRSLAEAFRGLDAIARDAGILPSTLRRALSRKGNPRMKVIEAIVEPMGLRLSVVPQPKSARKRVGKKTARTTRTRARAA